MLGNALQTYFGTDKTANPFVTVYSITTSELHNVIMPYLYHQLRSIY